MALLDAEVAADAGAMIFLHGAGQQLALSLQITSRHHHPEIDRNPSCHLIMSQLSIGRAAGLSNTPEVKLKQ